MNKVKFYSLLYIDTNNKSLSNNGINGTFHTQMKIFIKCCEKLNQSLNVQIEQELTVITNNEEYIRKHSQQLKLQSIPFKFECPHDISFYSAHFKIDVFNYFAKNTDDYSILIDSDALCINKMPINLINCIKSNIPVYYNITDQVYPAYGREKIISDKNILLNENRSTGIWAGGEFIGGNNIFYQKLYDEILPLKTLYFNLYKQLFHNGDEMLVSVALEKLSRSMLIVDAGSFGAIGRYWSSRTKHIQKPWNHYKDHFILHLPADKSFLANLDYNKQNFIKRYSAYIKTSWFFNAYSKLINWIKF